MSIDILHLYVGHSPEQLFGESARFHPQLHVLLTSGGWDTDGVRRSIFGWHRPALRELCEVSVLQREHRRARRRSNATGVA